MRSVVLVDRRSSLCFVFTIVHAVLRRMPSAFACSSNLVKPHAISASEICWSPPCNAVERPLNHTVVKLRPTGL